MIEFSLALDMAFRSGRLAEDFESSGGAPFYIQQQKLNIAVKF